MEIKTTPLQDTKFDDAPLVAVRLFLQVLDAETAIGYSPFCTGGPVLLNSAARKLLEAFSRPARPAEIAGRYENHLESRQAIQRLRELGLLLPAGQRHAPPVAVSKTLTVWLHLTERCNLRCLYCYLPAGGKDLPREVGFTALENAFASAASRGLKTVKLKYAGGEPSLRFDTLCALDDRAQELARESGLAVERVILSNGYALNERMLAELRRRDIALMISLDGLGPYQDGQRQVPNGAPSSERVMRTLERVERAGLLPHISITISRLNLPGLPGLLAHVLERGFPFHLNFFRENPYERSAGSLSLDPEELKAGLRAAYQVVERNLPPYPLTGALLDRVQLDLPHDRPCGAGQNYVVVRPDGGLCDCQMLEQGHGQLSMLADGAGNGGDLLALAASDPGTLLNLPSYRREGCAGCFWQLACAGGCSLLTFRTCGRWDQPSPYCAVYRDLIPEVLRLEGLRLKKYRLAENPLP